MKQNKKIAITGGIGSGKSTVSAILKRKGFNVYSCDEIYSELIKDSAFIKMLSDEFGDILSGDNSLDRKKLSAIVFSDAKKLERLNNITHPAIYQRMFEVAKDNGGVNFFEVPLLFEDSAQDLFDEVIVVLRDTEKRIEEVIRRDNLSREEVEQRIKSQINYEKSDFAKYYVIHNNGDFANLDKQLDKILCKI